MRLPSGIPGFDALLEGGFNAGSTLVLHGPAGRERDAFLIAFIGEALRSGAPALIVLSTDSTAAYQEALRARGHHLDRAIAENRVIFIDWRPLRKPTGERAETEGLGVPSSRNLASLGADITRAIAALPKGPGKRAVLEILSPALGIGDLLRVYALAQTMRSKLERGGFTSLFVLDEEKHDEQTVSTIRGAFSGVLDLRVIREGDVMVPRLSISLRGTSVASDAVALESGPDHPLRVRPSELERLLRAQEASTRSNPDDPRTWATTARIYQEAGDPEAALWAVETSLNIQPEAAELWRLKADLLEAVGRKEEAEHARSRGRVPPTEPTPKVGPAPNTESSVKVEPISEPEAAMDADVASRVLALCDSRLRDNPVDDGALFMKAAALAKLGDAQAAVGVLDTLLVVDPTYPGLWRLKAKLHETLGERPKADESWIRARESMEGTVSKVAAGSSESPDARRPSASRPPAASEPRGFTNGVQRGSLHAVGPTKGRVNGSAIAAQGNAGRVNGLSRDPQGRTNGVSQALVSMRAGLTNGLTTNSGFTNGLGSPRVSRDVRLLRQKLLLIPLVVAVLLFVPLLTPFGPVDGAHIAIDGDASDWATEAVARFSGSFGVNPNVDILRFGTADNGNALAFLIEVDGSALQGGTGPPTVDRFDIFVDIDRDVLTGYRVDGLGADRLIELTGWQGVVNGSALYEWDRVQDPYDWRGWSPSATVSSAASGGGLEAQVDWYALGLDKGPMFATVQARGFDGSTDVADYAVNPFGGAVVIVQEPIPAARLTGPNEPLLQLDVVAPMAAAGLRGLTVTLTGSARFAAQGSLQVVDGNGAFVDAAVPQNGRVVFEFPERRYAAGESERLVVVAPTPSGAGETLGAILSGPQDIVAPDAAITVHRLPSARDVGYVGAEVPFPRIDAGFAEWTTVVSDPVGDVQGGRDDDVDLAAFAAESSGNGTFFFAHAEGRLMAGTWVPEANALAPPSRVPVAVDTDRDGVPDSSDPLPLDFNNDGLPDAQSGGDTDRDGILEYDRGGTDLWLNTTIPASFPGPYAGRDVRVYIGPVERPFRSRDDVLRVFVDVDNATSSGYQLGGLGAERLIEVSGALGQVRSSGLFSFSGSYPGQWSWTRLSDVASALSFDYLEFAANEPLLNGSRVYVEIGEALGARDALGATSGASLARSQPAAAVSPQSASSFDAAPSPLSAAVQGSPAPPRVLDISGNTKYYLRDTTHATENDPLCTTDKVASTQGSGPTTSLTLSAGQTACWYADATAGTTTSLGDWETLLDIDTSVPKSAFKDGSSAAVPTGSIGLIDSMSTALPGKDNLVVATIQFDNTDGAPRSIAAGDLELRRGTTTVLADNQFAIDFPASAGSGDGMFAVLLYRDTSGTADPTYGVYGLASGSGVNAEVKFIVLNGLASSDSAFTDGGSVTVTGTTTSLASVTTSFAAPDSSLPNIIVAAVQSEFAASGEFTINAGNLVLRDGTSSGSPVLVSNEYAFGLDDPPTNDGISAVLIAEDESGGANQGYSVWGLSGVNNMRMEAKILAFRGLPANAIDGAHTNDIDTSRVVLGTATTSFPTGDDIVIGAIQIDAQTSAPLIPAAGDDIRRNSESSGSSNQFTHKIVHSASSWSDGQWQTFVRKVTTTSSSPSYEGGATGDATNSIDAELKLVAIHVNDSAAEYDVYLEIWNLDTNNVAEPIGSCLNVMTRGEDVQCLVAGVAAKTITSAQVVRIRVVHSSAAGQVVIDYDNVDPTGNSRATIPLVGIPEFEAVAPPFLTVILVSLLVMRKRQKARRPAPKPDSPDHSTRASGLSPPDLP